MRKTRQNAKAYIENAIQEEYDNVVAKAFLTLRQKKILLLKRTDPELTNWKIGNMINFSTDTVNHEMLKIYDKIAKVLFL